MTQGSISQVTRRDSCRLCGSSDAHLVMALTPTPPANAFVSEDKLNRTQACFPLDLFFCKACHHVQLLDVVDPDVLFRDYVYVSGTSPVFVQHFKDYADHIVDTFNIDTGKLAVDIGSNDGTLLRHFQNQGLSVLGIDPARDIAARASASGIETVADFFTPDLATRIRSEKGPAAVITANNVFAHADDLAGTADGIHALLDANGIFVFEVSYLLDVVEKLLFDTVYHEHVAYHSVAPLETFFKRHGLRLFKAERVSSHGGSLRGFVCRTDALWEEDGSVQSLIAQEVTAGLNQTETLIDFAKRIKARGNELSQLLQGLKDQGKSIAGFGAPAKATTLMYHFDIGPDLIDFVIDDSPLKQGLFTPGLHVPVVDASRLYNEHKPDYVVILAWNFAAPIIKNHASYMDNGGQFIVPLPELKVYGQ